MASPSEQPSRPRRPHYSRFSQTRKSELPLTSQDPLERLQQLKATGFYDFVFVWNKFRDGIMCEGEVFYNVNKQRRVLEKRSRFVLTEDPAVAQRVVASMLLFELGLDPDSKDKGRWLDSREVEQKFQEGVAQDEEARAEEEELNNQMQRITQVGLKFANVAIEKLLGGTLQEEANQKN